MGEKKGFLPYNSIQAIEHPLGKSRQGLEVADHMISTAMGGEKSMCPGPRPGSDATLRVDFATPINSLKKKPYTVLAIGQTNPDSSSLRPSSWVSIHCVKLTIKTEHHSN